MALPALAAGGAVVKFLKSPVFPTLILCAAAAVSGYFVYQHVLEKGKQVGIAQQKIETDRVQKRLTKIETALAIEEAAAKLAAIEQAALVAKLTADLEQASVKPKTIERVVTKEVIRYVTPTADAACTLTDGFVSLYDWSVSPTNLPPPSVGGNVDAASGIALSTATEIIGLNNAECLKRAAVIDAWQTWYAENRKIIDRALKAAQRSEKSK